MRGAAAKIINALESGAHRTHEIAAHSGVNQNQVYARLAELIRDGFVSAFRTLENRHGNEKFYRIRG